MKRRLGGIALLLIVAVTWGVADESYLTLVGFPGGSLWQRERRVVISEPTRLTENENQIQADELVLEAPLVTQGRPLRIDVMKLVFRGEGKIVAFTETAPANLVSGLSGDPGAPGEDFDAARYKGDERNGGPGNPGGPGRKGPPGIPGMPEPGEILIFAGTIEGKPRIDGRGQEGGRGGPGGPGGKGGRGGNGSHAISRAIGKDHPAGAGGPGAPGGPGGLGGDGGQGGKAVPVRLLIGKKDVTQDFSEVVSVPGAGGPNGPPGERGPWGDSGAGGDGDQGLLGLSRENSGGGPGAYSGAVPADLPENGFVAKIGPFPADSLQSQQFDELEDQRWVVYRAWYLFQWERALNLLIRDSLRLSSHRAWTREQVAARPDAVLESLSVSAVEKILQAWDRNFMAPLQDQTRDTPVSHQRERMVNLAREAISVLRGESDAKVLRNSLQDLDRDLKQALKQATDACQKLNESKVAQLSRFAGATRSYVIPVCSGSPDFSKKANLGAPIVLMSPISSKASVSGLKPDPLARIASFQFPSLLPSAWADAFRVEYIADDGLELARILAGEPTRAPTVLPEGMPIGYGVPEPEAVTLETLPRLLRALAIQLGAEG